MGRIKPPVLLTETHDHHQQQLTALPKEIAELVNARVRVRRGGAPAKGGKCVVYWMQRAERALDNPALDVAMAMGNRLKLPVVAFFSAIDNFPHANLRHYHFLQQGLADVEPDLAERNVGFVLRRPPTHEVAPFLEEVGAAVVVGDENPLRLMRAKRDRLARSIHIPYLTVDADVVVPSVLLEKAQHAAYTARPRLERLRPEWLQPCANLTAEQGWRRPKGLEHYGVEQDLTAGWKKLDRTVTPVEEFVGGTRAAVKRLRWFMQHGFRGYAEKRGAPEVDGSTKLSPYLHFGHIAPLTIALAAQQAVRAGRATAADRDSLFNELLVWRELAINFVTYNEQYDSWECADNWARKTLEQHAGDPREVSYTLEQLRNSETHDDLWNASRQMVTTGWMHNRMRMYWAKKILEWAPNPATAFDWAVILNDTYELDGRDPNGYAGIAWAIVGKFDRPWFERPIFGTVRYMSRASTGKKFDSDAYIAQYGGANASDEKADSKQPQLF
jgi:deoxyribodipyrimidine photo-lyase